MLPEDLIRSLTADLRPVRRAAAAQRVAVGIAVGSGLSLLAITFGLGLRPDLGAAATGVSFWMKAVYTLLLACLALAMMLRLSRPDAVRPRGLWTIALPILALVLLAMLELARTPRGDWLALWLGGSAQICPWLVFGLSLPIFLGLLWAFRRLAPMRLRAAGTTAGLVAGAVSATLYGLHCTEASALFVVTWYSLGIGLAALLGRLLGPRLLRW